MRFLFSILFSDLLSSLPQWWISNPRESPSLYVVHVFLYRVYRYAYCIIWPVWYSRGPIDYEISKWKEFKKPIKNKAKSRRIFICIVRIIIYPELGNTESSYQMTISSVRENTTKKIKNGKSEHKRVNYNTKSMCEWVCEWIDSRRMGFLEKYINFRESVKVSSVLWWVRISSIKHF